jgi:hypothetical protein
MANAWKTNNISFEAEGEQGVIELGKTHDLMPVRLNKNGEEDFDEQEHNKYVKESLPPWMTHPDNETLRWEHTREKKILELRNHKTYQFVMLVASFTNEHMDKYWTAPSEAQAEHTGAKQVGNTKGPACSLKLNKNDANQAFHKLYIDSPWLDGIIYLSPAIYGHMEESYVAITQVHGHLRRAPLNLFVSVPKIRTMFAKLVAMCIRTSDFLSQKRYNLDSTYQRLNMEKRRLMNYWKHIQYRSNTLMYFNIQQGVFADYAPPPSLNPNEIDDINDGNIQGLFKASMHLAINKM